MLGLGRGRTFSHLPSPVNGVHLLFGSGRLPAREKRRKKVLATAVKLALYLTQSASEAVMEDAGEVLELARTALARHRNWMATRRVQRTVAPLRSSENTSSQDVPGKIQPATWAVKNNSSTLPHTSGKYFVLIL